MNIYNWKNIYDNVVKNFVDDRYARNYGLHWANTENGFQKNIDEIYAFQAGVKNKASCDWIERLPEIVKCEKVYLLLEEKKQRAKYWIAECSPSIIHIEQTVVMRQYIPATTTSLCDCQKGRYINRNTLK